MGLGQNFLTRVGSGQFFVARVGSGQPFMVENRFGSGQKVPGSKPGRPLIYYRSIVSSSRVRAHLYSDLYW